MNASDGLRLYTIHENTATYIAHLASFDLGRTGSSCFRLIHSIASIAQSGFTASSAFPEYEPASETFENENMQESHRQAVEMSGARKNVQPAMTTVKTAAILAASPAAGNIRPSATVPDAYFLFFPARNNGRKQTAWNSPHARNVHEAPCQIPDTANIAKVLRIFLAVPQRLPPSGM